jgi:hypothetical protein
MSCNGVRAGLQLQMHVLLNKQVPLKTSKHQYLESGTELFFAQVRSQSCSSVPWSMLHGL